jgi:hypothetical protein
MLTSLFTPGPEREVSSRQRAVTALSATDNGRYEGAVIAATANRVTSAHRVSNGTLRSCVDQ